MPSRFHPLDCSSSRFRYPLMRYYRTVWSHCLRLVTRPESDIQPAKAAHYGEEFAPQTDLTVYLMDTGNPSAGSRMRSVDVDQDLDDADDGHDEGYDEEMDVDDEFYDAEDEGYGEGREDEMDIDDDGAADASSGWGNMSISSGGSSGGSFNEIVLADNGDHIVLHDERAVELYRLYFDPNLEHDYYVEEGDSSEYSVPYQLPDDRLDAESIFSSSDDEGEPYQLPEELPDSMPGRIPGLPRNPTDHDIRGLLHAGATFGTRPVDGELRHEIREYLDLYQKRAGSPPPPYRAEHGGESGDDEEDEDDESGEAAPPPYEH